MLAEKTAEWRARGAAVLHVVRDGVVVGALTLEDQVRPESAQAVNELHELGTRVVMITGDARQVADAVARRSVSTRSSPRCFPRTRIVPLRISRPAVCMSRWLAMA